MPVGGEPLERVRLDLRPATNTVSTFPTPGSDEQTQPRRPPQEQAWPSSSSHDLIPALGTGIFLACPPTLSGPPAVHRKR